MKATGIAMHPSESDGSTAPGVPGGRLSVYSLAGLHGFILRITALKEHSGAEMITVRFRIGFGSDFDLF